MRLKSVVAGSLLAAMVSSGVGMAFAQDSGSEVGNSAAVSTASPSTDSVSVHEVDKDDLNGSSLIINPYVEGGGSVPMVAHLGGDSGVWDSVTDRITHDKEGFGTEHTGGSGVLFVDTQGLGLRYAPENYVLGDIADQPELEKLINSRNGSGSDGDFRAAKEEFQDVLANYDQSFIPTTLVKVGVDGEDTEVTFAMVGRDVDSKSSSGPVVNDSIVNVEKVDVDHEDTVVNFVLDGKLKEDMSGSGMH